MRQSKESWWWAHPWLAFVAKPSVGQPTRATLAIRAVVGAVFVVSGLVKLVFVNQGPGRFEKLGFPDPALLAHFVAVVEVACGALLVTGLLVRLVALPLVFDMIVAVVTTKLPLLAGTGPEPGSALPKMGFWAFAYQARLDITMLVACAYLVAVGGGLWSLDALLSRRRWARSLLEEVNEEDAALARGR
jgi:uncharacterized membrane protein YphA (DoxX/SURF4 family)